jgi:hypothetical protein
MKGNGMNKLLFEYEFDNEFNVVKCSDDYIEFDNGLKFEFFHDQDCCEYVWADAENFKLNNLSRILIVKQVAGMGVLINDVLVNCYNDQNGYYSSWLQMKISHPDFTFTIDDIEKQDVGEQTY